MKEVLEITSPIGVRGTDIELDSPDWLTWLSTRKSFRYESTIAEYTCVKRSNGKWYAVKKQRGSRNNKQAYIGADNKVTKAKLESIARDFAKPDYDYWCSKQHKYTPKNQMVDSELMRDVNPGDTSGCITVSSSSSQTQEETTKLEAQIAELKLKLSSTEKKLEHEAADAQRYYVLWRKYPDLERQLERTQTKLEESQKLTAELTQEIETLKERSHFSDLDKVRDRFLLTQPPGKRRDLKKMLDQFINHLADS